MNNIKIFFNKYLILATIFLLLSMFVDDTYLSNILIIYLFIFTFLFFSIKKSLNYFKTIKSRIIYFILLLLYCFITFAITSLIYLIFFAKNL